MAPWAPAFAGVTSFWVRSVRIAPLGDRNRESSRLDGAEAGQQIRTWHLLLQWPRP